MTISGTDISMTRGDTESITIVMKNGVLNEGDTITFSLRQKIDEPIVLQKVITDFYEDGTVAIIDIEHEDTATLEFGKYFYDIQLTTFDGAITTVVKPARFTLENEVTY